MSDLVLVAERVNAPTYCVVVDARIKVLATRSVGGHRYQFFLQFFSLSVKT